VQQIVFLVGPSRFFLNFGLSFHKIWIGYPFRDVSQVGLAEVGPVETRLIFNLRGVLKAHSESGSVVLRYIIKYYSIAIVNSGNMSL
jgi:hypothetical protein